MKLWSKVLTFFRKEKLDTEMAEEMRAHLELQTAENIARGMSSEDAHYSAQRQFGGVEQIKESCRDERRRGFVWLEQLGQDLRYAARGLRKNPGFTATAVVTLGLGMGVNAALFSIYNAIALRPLPVREPEELLILRRPGSQPQRIAYSMYQEFRDGSHSFSGLAAWTDFTKHWGEQHGGGPTDPHFAVQERGFGSLRGFVNVQAVSGNYFDVLRADVARGRGFLPEESSSPVAPAVIVLQHLFWERQLQSDPQVLGKTVSLNGRPYVVVGVAAEGFVGHQPAPPIGWVPLMTEMWPGALTSPHARVSVIGRLNPDVVLSQAQADLKLISDRLAQTPEERRDPPPLDRGMKFMQIPINHETVPIFAPIVIGFLMVLLIACSNVANLMLARGITRQQEIAVRLTLGASRGRIVRQLLTENILLCGLAALFGLLVAQWTLSVIQPLLPAAWGLPGGVRQWRSLFLGPDHRVVLATSALVLLATLATGLLPALQVSRTHLISALKETGTVFGRQLSPVRLRNLLVIVQVAVCLMLLSCAGLLARNMLALRKLDVGFDAHSAFSTLLDGQNIASPDRATRAAANLRALEAVRGLPGVSAACQVLGRGRNLLDRRGLDATSVVPRGGRGTEFAEQKLHYLIVSAGFFETFKLPVLRGRAFSVRDIETTAPVVVVSESAAARLWPGEEAVGRTLAVDARAFTWPEGSQPGFRECVVIGVARDRRGVLGEAQPPTMYLPLTAEAGEAGALYVRPQSDSAFALAELTRLAAREGLTLLLTERLALRAEQRLAPFVALGWVSGALGLLALTMAAVGLGGVMAFVVNQRVREIGIRVALGATTQRITRLFLSQGMKIVSIGVALGLSGSVVIAVLLRKIMFGLGNAFDPVALVVVTAILGAVALLACWLPARRAAKVDPMVALRCE